MEPLTITLAIVGAIGLVALALVLRYNRKASKSKHIEQ